MDSMNTSEAPGASAGSIAAPLLVLGGTVVAALCFVIGTGGDPERGVGEAGDFAYLAIALSLMTTLATAVLVRSASRGRPEHAVFGCVLLVVPWAVMVVCMATGVDMVARVLEGVDPTSLRPIAAMGTAEIMSARVLGASLVAGGALGLAIALFVFVGGREPDERGATRTQLVYSALLLFGIFAISIASIADAKVIHDGLSAVAHADPSSRATLLAATLEAGAPTYIAILSLSGIASLAGLVAIAGAYRSSARDVRVVATVWVVGALFAIVDIAALHAIGRALAVPAPWVDAPDFTPTRMRENSGALTTVACVATQARVRCGASEARYDALSLALPRVDAEQLRANQTILFGAPRETMPDLVLALDARLPSASLVRLIDGAVEAGYGALVVVGDETPAALLSGLVPPLLRAQVPQVATQTWRLAPIPAGSTETPFVVELRDTDTAQTVAARVDAAPDGAVIVTPRPLPRAVAPRPAEAVAELLGTGPEGMMGRDATAVPPPDAPTGPLDAATVQRIMRANVPAVRRCYEAGLQTNPTLSGRIDVRFAIAPRGAVTSVSTSGTLDSPAVARCIEAHIAAIVFPSDDRREPMSVTYPFVFNASP